jgi:hypothetical protein
LEVRCWMKAAIHSCHSTVTKYISTWTILSEISEINIGFGCFLWVDMRLRKVSYAHYLHFLTSHAQLGYWQSDLTAAVHCCLSDWVEYEYDTYDDDERTGLTMFV